MFEKFISMRLVSSEWNNYLSFRWWLDIRICDTVLLILYWSLRVFQDEYKENCSSAKSSVSNLSVNKKKRYYFSEDKFGSDFPKISE